MSLIISAKEFGNGVARVYRRYAEWLVSITWKRFILLSILLMILAGVLSGIPPFSWDIATRTTRVPASRNVDISIDEQGVRIKPKKKSSHAPEITIDENGIRIKRQADAHSGKPAQEIIVDDKGVQLRNPDGAANAPAAPPAAPKAPAAPSSFIDDVRREVIDEVRREVAQARRETDQARRDAEQAKRDADQLRKELEQDLGPLAADIRREVSDAIAEMGEAEHVAHIRLGNYLPQVAFLFILLSAAIKIAHSGRVKAEAKAAEAREVAEEESLKRQVVEARMAAMQAQVEPHFLFNTLASIDHLIEVDPPRASRMQKNLIALLRASMPAMREKATNLGRELDVVRPYLEILKVRMEERLRTEVTVPEGLSSADFPPMMLQSLVENAIKHGLEPMAEGGSLTVSAEVVHGKLAVTVADTGVGFARAATAGTGMGLNNIRERLKLIYGDAAELRIADNPPTGTRVTIVVPYKAT
jgi:signal transduction histidine kinase